MEPFKVPEDRGESKVVGQKFHSILSQDGNCLGGGFTQVCRRKEEGCGLGSHQELNPEYKIQSRGYCGCGGIFSLLEAD